MRRIRLAMLSAGIALLAAGVNSSTALAQNANKPQATPQSPTPPMVKPPDAASGATSASNPDNMPIKRPPKPTNDKMMREPPASGANAK